VVYYRHWFLCWPKLIRPTAVPILFDNRFNIIVDLFIGFLGGLFPFLTQILRVLVLLLSRGNFNLCIISYISIRTQIINLQFNRFNSFLCFGGNQNRIDRDTLVHEHRSLISRGSVLVFYTGLYSRQSIKLVVTCNAQNVRRNVQFNCSTHCLCIPEK
jgi:hypothetical protein